MTPADIVARLRARAVTEESRGDPLYISANTGTRDYAARVIREEADAIEREAGPSLPVLRTCGMCHDCDPPSYDTKADERPAYCVHPDSAASDGNPSARIDRNAAPPDWCPLRERTR